MFLIYLLINHRVNGNRKKLISLKRKNIYTFASELLLGKNNSLKAISPEFP